MNGNTVAKGEGKGQTETAKLQNIKSIIDSLKEKIMF